MQRKVYAVTSGSYSDYRVRALFEKKADAERHAESVRLAEGFSDADVTWFSMFPEGEVPERVFVYRVETILSPDGEIVSDKEWSYDIWSTGDYDDPPGKRPKVKVGQAPAYGKGWFVRVEARTAKGARKAASDAAAQKRAELLRISH